MAGNAEAMDDLRRILNGRHALYAKADGAVDTTGQSIEDSLADLLAVVRRETNVQPAARDKAPA
jgi:XRE family aerobic/anaerobic benzoate catabolism transcriptional regulator